MKAMGVPELKIYHVKSHLQKYRISKLILESPTRGKLEKRSISDILPNFSSITVLHPKEVLQMQTEMQNRLSDKNRELFSLLRASMADEATYPYTLQDAQNALNPLYIHPNESPSTVLVSPPLSDGNYHSWSRAMKMSLLTKNKLGFVDSTIVEPPKNHAVLPFWE
ncbi:hypothetical protein GLYMA_07G150850v4 [Glycine max]|nr:hypothetical protein GLYMA_07G150850v4 [Glycine max]KAH1086964.1 hypothetical protein GYH30_018470 [Glycine max]